MGPDQVYKSVSTTAPTESGYNPGWIQYRSRYVEIGNRRKFTFAASAEWIQVVLVGNGGHQFNQII